jgi:hypothetical protein
MDATRYRTQGIMPEGRHTQNISIQKHPAPPAPEHELEAAVGRVRDPTSWFESDVWLGYCLLCYMPNPLPLHATAVASACHTRRCVPHPPLRAATVSACHSRLCVPQPSLHATAVASDGHGVMAIHRAQSREARGLHQSPHGQRPVAPRAARRHRRAARRHRNAPLHVRLAGHGRALDPARAPHAGVVGAARAPGRRSSGGAVEQWWSSGGAGVGVGTACCKMLCVTAGWTCVMIVPGLYGGLMPGGC